MLSSVWPKVFPWMIKHVKSNILTLKNGLKQHCVGFPAHVLTPFSSGYIQNQLLNINGQTQNNLDSYHQGPHCPVSIYKYTNNQQLNLLGAQSHWEPAGRAVDGDRGWEAGISLFCWVCLRYKNKRLLWYQNRRQSLSFYFQEAHGSSDAVTPGGGSERGEFTGVYLHTPSREMNFVCSPESDPTTASRSSQLVFWNSNGSFCFSVHRLRVWNVIRENPRLSSKTSDVWLSGLNHLEGSEDGVMDRFGQKRGWTINK